MRRAILSNTFRREAVWPTNTRSFSFSFINGLSSSRCGTNRTTTTRTPIRYICLPFMVTIRTQPPNFFMAAKRHIMRCKRSIFGGMPLRCQLRMCSRKVIKARKNKPSCTDRAPCFFLTAGIDCCFPFMSARSKPPYLFVGACRHITGR